MSRRSVLLLALGLLFAASAAQAKPPIYIAFHWHMHQPIYWPYESVLETNDQGRYGFGVLTVHTDRTGPYTTWPRDAVRMGMDAGLDHLGAQVSLSGSLMENLDVIEGAGRGFSGWKGAWQEAVGWRTSMDNPRLDLVKFGYHHPLMALIDHGDIVRQVRMHELAIERRFGAGAASSKGMFPPETGFAEWMIPALRESGVEWIMVDNIHFDRARPDYPWNSGSNLVPPNGADQRNSGGDVTWVQLNNLWAPTRVSAPWGYQPHWAVHVDPDTGEEHRIIVVPAARYEGNEDARGGYGAFLYGDVMAQYEAQNTDDDHPMLVVLHHDGDNYGGGTDSYYHSNFANFVAWLQSQPDRFVCTTIQDYIDRFPPAEEDVIHVEPGSWSGADNGDAEFHKWNGDPDASGYSPDRASWSVMTAAHNRVATAESVQPGSSIASIVDASGNDTDKAWHYLLNAETSCYWYWDGAENGIWDSHPARACNMAVDWADRVLGGQFADNTPPSIYAPQREPYNPGGMEWGGSPEPSDFTVWTYVYDVSGLESVTLHYRVDDDGVVHRDNELRTGDDWVTLDMTARSMSSTADPTPRYLADEYSAVVAGLDNTLVDYWVEARDAAGNTARSPILHVYVGEPTGGGPVDPGGRPAGVHWIPEDPWKGETFTVWVPREGWLHWGVNDWQTPPEACQPAGSFAWSDGIAVETPLDGPDEDGYYGVELGPFVDCDVDRIDFVIRHSDSDWDNNGGQNYRIDLLDEEPDRPEPTADAGSPVVAEPAVAEPMVVDAGGSTAEPFEPGRDVSEPGPADDTNGGGQVDAGQGTAAETAQTYDSGPGAPDTQPGAGNDVAGVSDAGGGGCAPTGSLPGPSGVILFAGLLLALWAKRRSTCAR